MAASKINQTEFLQQEAQGESKDKNEHHKRVQPLFPQLLNMKNQSPKKERERKPDITSSSGQNLSLTLSDQISKTYSFYR